MGQRHARKGTKLSRRLIALALAGAAIAGCVHVPPAPISPMASAAQLQARTLEDETIAADLARLGLRPAQSGWSIDALTVAAWDLRTEVAVARADITAARAGERVAALGQNPTVTIGPGAALTNNNGDISPWIFATTIDFTVETGGKRQIRAAQAQAQTQTLQWQLAETLWSVRAQMRKAVIGRAYAQAARSSAEQEVTLRLAYLDWVQTELRFGVAAQPELLSAQTNLAQAQNQSRAARGAAALADEQLASALGVATDKVPLTAISTPALDAFPDANALTLAALRDDALVNRLSVRHALADYGVTEENLRAAVAKQYPDIMLGPSYSFDRGDHLFNMSIGFTVPLFHDERDAIAQSVALRDKAGVQFQAAQAQTMTEIDAARARYRAAADALAEAANSVGVAQTSFGAAQRRLALGAADRGEVLTAQIVLLQAQRFVLDTQKAVWDALGALEDSVQRPLWPQSDLRTPQPDPAELMP